MKDGLEYYRRLLRLNGNLSGLPDSFKSWRMICLSTSTSEKEPQTRGLKKKNNEKEKWMASCRQLRSAIPAARQKEKIDPAWKETGKLSLIRINRLIPYFFSKITNEAGLGVPDATRLHEGRQMGFERGQAPLISHGSHAR